jgi:hypothetical protein
MRFRVFCTKNNITTNKEKTSDKAAKMILSENPDDVAELVTTGAVTAATGAGGI